jgi:hypothetical protein
MDCCQTAHTTGTRFVFRSALAKPCLAMEAAKIRVTFRGNIFAPSRFTSPTVLFVHLGKVGTWEVALRGPSRVRTFVCSFVRSFVRSFVHPSIHSFIHSSLKGSSFPRMRRPFIRLCGSESVADRIKILQCSSLITVLFHSVFVIPG